MQNIIHKNSVVKTIYFIYAYILKRHYIKTKIFFGVLTFTVFTHIPPKRNGDNIPLKNIPTNDMTEQTFQPIAPLLAPADQSATIITNVGLSLSNQRSSRNLSDQWEPSSRRIVRKELETFPEYQFTN